MLSLKKKKKDGGTHFHVLLISQNKINITDDKFFHITVYEKMYHGNYQKALSMNNVVEHVFKQSKYITNISNIRQSKIASEK